MEAAWKENRGVRRKGRRGERKKERERGGERKKDGKRNESRLRNHERQGSGGEVGFCGAGATGRGEQGSPIGVGRPRHTEGERIEQER